MTQNRTFHHDDQATIASEYSNLRRAVDKDVKRVTESYIDSLGDLTSPLSLAALDATEGGKRFRALCAQIGAAVANAASDVADSPLSAPRLLQHAAALPGMAELAVALEQYQAAALVHDDVIDKSDSRRGRPSGHIQLSNVHRDQDMLGDPQTYGQDGAVLAGDLLLAAAENSLASALEGAGEGIAVAVLRHYALMTGEVALGQFRDMTGAYIDPTAQHEPDEGNAALASALAVVRVKAARYSVLHPTLLGAIRQGADQELLDTLSSILEPAGVAFQLRDDALGAFGETSTTGKPVGIDISEGKRTVLLALAWKNSSPRERDFISAVYRNPAPSTDDIARAAEILRRNGYEDHEEMIRALREEALQNLDAADLPGAGKDLLRFLVGLLTERDS